MFIRTVNSAVLSLEYLDINAHKINDKLCKNLFTMFKTDYMLKLVNIHINDIWDIIFK